MGEIKMHAKVLSENLREEISQKMGR